MTYTPQLMVMIDPRRITERIFGGPKFATFEIVTDHRVICIKTGDVFDTCGLNDALMETRNLAPIIYGTGPRPSYVEANP